jgi:hypothetical protein
LENPDLVVEALHETKRDLVLRPAIGAIPSQCRSIMTANFS